MAKPPQCRCFNCKKRPAYCTCAEYRIEPTNSHWVVYVDSVATEPVSGQSHTWQSRSNAREWLRPQFVDGFGPIMIITKESTKEQIQEAIDNKTFYVFDFEGVDGCRVIKYDKTLLRRLSFFRKSRAKRTEAVVK